MRLTARPASSVTRRTCPSSDASPGPAIPVLITASRTTCATSSSLRIWKSCVRPARMACLRSSRADSEWNVPRRSRRATSRPMNLATRSLISSTALLVKVTTVIRAGSTPASVRKASLPTSMRVLPVPAPAMTIDLLASVVAAATCSGSSPSSAAPLPRGDASGTALRDLGATAARLRTAGRERVAGAREQVHRHSPARDPVLRGGGPGRRSPATRADTSRPPRRFGQRRSSDTVNAS